MKCIVTGGLGFIGGVLVRRLVRDGHDVTIVDNSLRAPRIDKRVRYVTADVVGIEQICDAFEGANVVFHLAAHADVKENLSHPGTVFEQNALGTLSVLEAMRRTNVRCLVFASTGSVYGEPGIFPTPESAPMPIQTSIYAASKLASEGLITAYAEGFGVQAYIFRFVSNVGEGYSHGHVLDFYRKLKSDPQHIQILGDGKQRKSYVDVSDTVEGILCALEHAKDKINIFNLGTDEYCTVLESLAWICERMNVRPEITCAGGTRGWVGDSPFIYLDSTRLRSLGWVPKLTIREGIVRTIDYFERSGI